MKTNQMKINDMKRRKIAVILSLSCLLASPVVMAGGEKGGATGAGGGGSRIESAFRIRAYDLISKISVTPAANSICPALSMQDALEHTRIRTVRTLVNPDTHQPITDQGLDAWTMKGDMQLLPVWAGYLNAGEFSAKDKSIDVLILHEIYRATTGCDDESFRLSSRIPQLLNQPTRYSWVFKLKYMWYGDNWAGPCEKNTNGDPGNCAVIKIDSKGQSRLWIGRNLTSGVLPSQTTHRIANWYETVTPEHPFYVVYDTTAGTISCGTDLGHLIQLP